MSSLDSLIRRFELDWMIESYAPPDGALPAYSAALDAANADSARRFGKGNFPITVDALHAELEPHPYRVEAFLQALAATSSPEMLVLTWRILSGWEIAHVTMSYDYCKAFSLIVILREDDDGGEEEYRSDNITDAALVRHLGIAKKGGKPYFDGFYPLHLSR